MDKATKARIEELERKVAELEARPQVVNHHYHYTYPIYQIRPQYPQYPYWHQTTAGAATPCQTVLVAAM